MARIKGGLNAKKKHNRVLKLAKGYRGARSKQYRVAKQSVMRALQRVIRAESRRRDSSDSYGLPESMLLQELTDFHTASSCMVLS